MVHALIVGKRLQGKSTLALALALERSHLVVIYDPNNQYREWPALPLSMINQEVETASTVEGPLVIRILRYVPADPENDFKALADILWPWDGYSIIVDEASILQSPHTIDPSLDRMARRSPAGVTIIQTAHRVADLNRLCRGMATDYYFFRSTQAKDVQRIAEEFDDRLAVILPKLRPYEVAHHWQGKTGDCLSVWKDSKRWFVEIGRGEKITDDQDEPLELQPSLVVIEPGGLTAQGDDPALAGGSNAGNV